MERTLSCGDVMYVRLINRGQYSSKNFKMLPCNVPKDWRLECLKSMQCQYSPCFGILKTDQCKVCIVSKFLVQNMSNRKLSQPSIFARMKPVST